MPSTRGLLTTGAGVLSTAALPGIISGIISAIGPDPTIGLPIISGIGVVVTLVGTIIVYIKDRRASRRALEKSVFGKVLNRVERKDLAPQYKAAKARAKADEKAEKVALKAEEKIRKKELQKVIKDRIRKKVKELPLKVVLGTVKFLNTLVVEIPKVTVGDIGADAEGVVQGTVQPIPVVLGPDDLLGKPSVVTGANNAASNFVTSPAATVGNLPVTSPPALVPRPSPPVANNAASLPATPI
ncbi:hypothetical protein TWF694_007253 [Orbilia ellipsospora]|uniref:Uncharacterized protein n=1 Tax=Orbilia ellipsospora TaxID=2528407 RepID=A0AAV9XHB1_9PEZI